MKPHTRRQAAQARQAHRDQQRREKQAQRQRIKRYREGIKQKQAQAREAHRGTERHQEGKPAEAATKDQQTRPGTQGTAR